jgi:phospholipid/cholesterol/gamma-HCH transport system substrate-binding protein
MRPAIKPLIKLCAFAVLTVFLTAGLAQTLGAFGASGTTYRARFTDVAGVLVGDEVRIAGVKVGEVSGIRLVERDKAELSFTVDKSIPLATTTRAKIRYRNLVGQRYLALFEGASTGERLRANGLIPLTQTAPALDLTVVFNGFRPLFTGLSPQDVNNFAFEIIKVLQGEGGTVNHLLDRTASLTNTLAERDQLIGRVITNLNDVLGTLDQRDKQLSETVKQLQLFVSGLAQDRVAIGEAIAHIGDLAQVTTGLLQEARPSLAADITALDSLMGTLQANTSTIESTLATAPGRLEALTRTASYGSWFNFYLCDFDGHVTFNGQSLNPATFHGTTAKC